MSSPLAESPPANTVAIVNYQTGRDAMLGYLSGEADATFSHPPYTFVDPERPMRTPPERTMLTAHLMSQWKKPAHIVWMATRCFCPFRLARSLG